MTSSQNGTDGAFAGRSLRSIFDEMQRRFQHLEDSDLSASDPKYQEEVSLAIIGCEQCAVLVRALSIFSSNELLEDINTTDLRFLLVDFYAGELQNRKVSDSRLSDLRKSKGHFENFLFTCYTHGILTEEDKKYLDAETSKKPKDAAQQRNEKIARFKREKAAKAKMDSLLEKLALSAKSSGSSDDEEIDRELLLTTLDLSIQRAISSVRTVMDEIDLLEKLEKEKRSTTGLEDRLSRVEVRTEKPTALLSKDGKPLQPFIITNKREQLQNGVFRYGHNLPTMTIDEFLENEIKRGNFLSGGTERPKTPILDDNDEKAVDDATIKAREFDDFKDANPRGWGNRGNKG
ncbi:TAP42-like protein [Zopfochytrium polystomum]|nr:TAP42-like protein [Zopfochytrium polystomum]